MFLSDTVVKELDAGTFDAYIGKRLRLRRTMLKMSQDDLASVIGVTFQQIQKYESGVNRISASRLFLIAKVLSVDVSFFFDGLEKDVPATKIFDKPYGVSEEEISFDPMYDNETLQLVNAYWKVQDDEKRKKILDFITTMV